uniref:Checkpoint protein n=1 Tax=Aplanochytrium stocchinoi TaxID=215587 RepID=A0A6S8CRH6_9STRA|mmetsp:Transcript_21627/g.26181  ORF Transcript_21627/g.26181 Transcript_21627/m.26181 type:complete len:294 (-) Transcript_21627:477-1358(-)
MKFRAVLSNDGVKVFLGIAQSLQKLTDECVIHMTEDLFEFRVKPDVNNNSEIQVFAKFFTEAFTDYHIESKAENKISIVVRVRNLVRAFKSAGQAMEAVFKLTKPDNVPCFSVVASEISTCLGVKQDVPITSILSKSGLSEYREPRLPTPDITMEFPDPRNVKAILERMKALDRFVHMEASTRGNLVFKVQTEVVSMRTFFSGLDVQQSKSNDDENENDDAMSVRTSNSFRSTRRVSVQLNIKEVLNVLQFASLHSEKVLLCVVKDQAMVLYADLQNSLGSLTYYLPVCTALD